MQDLLRGYGRALTALFFLAVLIWGLALIILPQLTMFERAITAPKRALDSSVAQALIHDAQTCISVLERHQNSASIRPTQSGGMAIPSLGMTPSAMAVPSIGGVAAGSSKRPYVAQCDRSTTHVSLVRDLDTPAWLDETYGLPKLWVEEAAPIDQQIAQAQAIVTLMRGALIDLRAIEAKASPYTFENFARLIAARHIPIDDNLATLERQKLSNKMLTMIGLRYEQDGLVHERIGIVTLLRTLVFASSATALALVLCYPMAYKVALATPREQAMWLFLGLIIPYAIVELMRVYAWTVIIDNNGLINTALQWLGVISDPIQLKRYALTVFIVIVYTYVLFMVFPMYNVMSTLDKNQLEAARDLGASAWRVHWRIIIPHAKPGIAVGTISTFMLAAGAFSVPRIISRGLQAEWFSQTIYNKFFESENSNVGAAYSFAYTLVCFALVAVFMWIMRTRLKDFARVQ